MGHGCLNSGSQAMAAILSLPNTALVGVARLNWSAFLAAQPKAGGAFWERFWWFFLDLGWGFSGKPPWGFLDFWMFRGFSCVLFGDWFGFPLFRSIRSLNFQGPYVSQTISWMMEYLKVVGLTTKGEPWSFVVILSEHAIPNESTWRKFVTQISPLMMVVGALLPGELPASQEILRPGGQQ